MNEKNLWNIIKINDNDTVPKYKQLQLEIERLIAENILKVTDRLPGENEFFSNLGLSRTTIRKALHTLEKSHLIYRIQGHGTFIGSKPAAMTDNGDKKHISKFKKLIGVVIPNRTNEIYPFLINGIEQTVQSRQICVFSANSGGSHERELRIINEMINNSIDGLILEPLYSGKSNEDKQLVSLLEELDIPIVLINNDIPTFNCSKVMQDDAGGAQQLTELLLEHGHKRIAYIYNNMVKASFERRSGFHAALKAAGIEPDERLEASYNDEDGMVYPGYVLTKQFLENQELGVTAIFYFNDDLALQGLTAAHSLNMEVPRDISIVGYDDIPRSRLEGIQLTTVSHPKTLLGNMAASLLLEQFEQEEHPLYRKITIHSSMVLRDSVSEPRSFNS